MIYGLFGLGFVVVMAYGASRPTPEIERPHDSVVKMSDTDRPFKVAA
jgi:hypothetical protein